MMATRRKPAVMRPFRQDATDDAVAELCHHLITRLRLLHIAAALVVVETQAEESLIATVGAHCDRVVRL